MTETHTYDAANQVEGWTYDAAGNLLADGTATYTYDALSRVLTASTGSQQRSYTSNGDGTLVAQTANGVQTSFTQDLAAPLSQILQTAQGGATTNYLYGLERLASVSGTMRTWYTGDALGSVPDADNNRHWCATCRRLQAIILAPPWRAHMIHASSTAQAFSGCSPGAQCSAVAPG